MSYDIYYTINENKKSYLEIETLFFGKQRVFDYKEVCDNIFDTYSECLKYINDNGLSFCDIHIRRTISTGGGVMRKDYIYRRSF